MSACGAISEGAWQTVSIKTEPKEAFCRVSRDGMVLGEIESTPGQVSVTKTFSDLRIECRKAGYADSLHFNRSDVAGAAVMSWFFLGAAGVQIERDAGAIRRYDDEVLIPLVRPGEPPKPLVVVEQPRGAGGKQPRPALRAVANEPIPPVQKAAGATSRKSPKAPAPASPAAATESAGKVDPSPTEEILTLAPPQTPSPLPTPAVAAAPPPAAPPLAESPVETIVLADAAPAVAPAPAPMDPYLVRRLENLKEIFDRKALTPAEYERKRGALMAGR